MFSIYLKLIISIYNIDPPLYESRMEYEIDQHRWQYNVDTNLGTLISQDYVKSIIKFYFKKGRVYK